MRGARKPSNSTDIPERIYRNITLHKSRYQDSQPGRQLLVAQTQDKRLDAASSRVYLRSLFAILASSGNNTQEQAVHVVQQHLRQVRLEIPDENGREGSDGGREKRSHDLEKMGRPHF